MRIEVEREQGTTNAVVSFFDDAGVLARKEHRSIAADLIKAHRTRRALADVIAEGEGEKAAKRPRRAVLGPVADAPVAQDHTHEEFSYPVGEHEHEDKEHTHPHGHGEIVAVDDRLNRVEGDLAGEMIVLRKDLSVHGHDDKAALAHEHAAIEQQVANVASLVTGLRDRPLQTHDHPHQHEEFQGYEGQIKAIWTAILEMKRLVEGHAHPAVVHTHDMPKHEHEELAEHIAATERKANARILSTHEVGGKDRWVVEIL